MFQQITQYIISVPPSGEWKAFYIQNGTRHGFSMHLSFGTSGDLHGLGKDTDVFECNSNEFDVKGNWNMTGLSFEKTYRGGSTIYYNADMDLDSLGYIEGWYSFSDSGPKADKFHMTKTSAKTCGTA